MDAHTSTPQETSAVDAMSRAVEQLADLVDRVAPDQTSAPTPCPSWDVATLLDHVVADLTHFRAAARGEEVDWSAAPPSVAPDWAAEFRRGAAELVAAFRADASASRATVPADMPTAEFSVHAWDLAAAIGADRDLDPVPAERALAMMQGMLQPEMRGSEADGKAFGPEQEGTDGMSAVDRLVAFAGRDPHWSPDAARAIDRPGQRAR